VFLFFPTDTFISSRQTTKAGATSTERYEGTISDPDWNHLSDILDRKEFRDLNIPEMAGPAGGGSLAFEPSDDLGEFPVEGAPGFSRIMHAE